MTKYQELWEGLTHPEKSVLESIKIGGPKISLYYIMTQNQSFANCESNIDAIGQITWSLVAKGLCTRVLWEIAKMPEGYQKPSVGSVVCSLTDLGGEVFIRREPTDLRFWAFSIESDIVALQDKMWRAKEDLEALRGAPMGNNHILSGQRWFNEIEFSIDTMSKDIAKLKLKREILGTLL